MDCPNEETLIAFVDGELDAAVKAAAEAHLGGCPACAKLLAALIDDAFEDAPGTPEQAASALETGGRIGRYLVLAPIGAGGMGLVYKAYDPELGRQVALKLLRPRADGRGDASTRLLREAQAMARLSHPNVVAVYDAGTWQSQVFIAMELVDGGTLAEWRAAKKRSWREIVHVFLRAGQGLAAAHQAGLVHRDFKPDNVLIGDDGRVRVTDFGLARIADGEVLEGISADRLPTPLQTARLPASALHSPLTHTGTLLGSPAYMAPEQMQGGAADARSDIFSFCVALYESLCGERPFGGVTFTELREEVRGGRLRELPKALRLPPFLRELLARGLRVRPEDRFTSMDELLVLLEHGPAQRTRRRWASVALAALLALGLAFVLDSRRRDPARLCPSAQPEMARVWNEARRQRLEKAFLATPVWFAQEQARTAERGLDAYAAAWVSMRDETCRGTRVLHSQGEELQRARTRCLDQRLQDLSALVDLFMTADAKQVPRARSAVASLAPISTCSARVLDGAEQPRGGPEMEARLAAANRAMAEARSQTGLGAYQKSFALLGPVVTTARELRYGALEAEAQLLQGLNEDHLGHYQSAERLLRDAAVGAQLARRDDVAARAFQQLIFVAGIDLHRVDEALRWADFDELVIERLGNPIDLEQARQQHLGGVLAQHGRAAEARPYLERALRLAEQNMGPEAPQNGVVVEALAVGLVLDHRPEEAIPLFRRALRLSEKLVQPGHPRLGEIESNLAETLLNAGHPVEAEATARRALGILEAALGADHMETANIRSVLSHALRERGAPAEALALAQRSQAFCDKPGNCEEKYLGATTCELGEVLLALDRPAEARPLLERSVAARLKVGDDELPISQFALARALWPLPPARARSLELAGKARASYAVTEPRLLAQVDAWLSTRTRR